MTAMLVDKWHEGLTLADAFMLWRTAEIPHATIAAIGEQVFKTTLDTMNRAF